MSLDELEQKEAELKAQLAEIEAKIEAAKKAQESQRVSDLMEQIKALEDWELSKICERLSLFSRKSQRVSDLMEQIEALEDWELSNLGKRVLYHLVLTSKNQPNMLSKGYEDYKKTIGE